MPFHCSHLIALICALVATAGSAASLAAPVVNPVEVRTAADMPRFSYPFQETATRFAERDDATFNGFAAKVRDDINQTLDLHSAGWSSHMARIIDPLLASETHWTQRQAG